MEDKIVRNKALRRTLEKVAEGDEAVYPRYRTEMFMKLFWILAVAVIFYVNYTVLNPAAMSSHAVTFISGVLAIKGWQFIPAYMELGEEVGLIIPEEEDGGE